LNAPGSQPLCRPLHPEETCGCFRSTDPTATLSLSKSKVKYKSDCRQHPADLLAYGALGCLSKARLELQLGDMKKRSEAAVVTIFVKQRALCLGASWSPGSSCDTTSSFWLFVQLVCSSNGEKNADVSHLPTRAIAPDHHPINMSTVKCKPNCSREAQ